jgi:predicted TPR repeat methyltransferase
MSVDSEHSVKQEELPKEMGVHDALVFATRMHRLEEFGGAETVYRRILDVAPDHPDALHFLGVLLHQRDRSDEAVELIERSIALDPGQPGRYNNLGNVLVERGRLAEAAEAYRRVIALEPRHADAYNNLGALLRTQGQFEEAAAAYEQAIELNPEHVDAYSNYGNLLSSTGRIKEAVQYYCKAITLAPNHAQSRKLLGVAYYSIGQIEAAAEVFRDWLRIEPDNPVAQHMFAACSGQNVPERASDAYVEATFDAFAGSFDAKLERLGYRAPQLIADALAKACGAPYKQLDALDAGCGTGLCGPLISPYVCRLTGVDLSSRMLASARQRGAYDEVEKAELTAYLNEHPDTFDLVVSADTLVYFGALEVVFAAACRALRSGGLFIFTVEVAVDEEAVKDYRINPYGRYSHNREYVRRTLQGAGMDVPSVEPAVLRSEGGSPVAGLVVTGRRRG